MPDSINLVAWDSCLPGGTTELSSPQLPLSGVGVECSSPVVASKGCIRNPKAQEAQSLSTSADCAKSSFPEPTKEGEGKEHEHKSAEALKLVNVRQLVCPLEVEGLPGMFWQNGE